MNLDNRDLQNLEELLDFFKVALKKRIQEEQSQEESPIEVIDALYGYMDIIDDFKERLENE